MSSRSLRQRVGRRFAKARRDLYEWLVRFGNRLTAPMEEFSKRSVERVSLLADLFNQFETRALNAGIVALRPLKFLARLPKRIIDRLISPRWVATVADFFGDAVKRFREAFVWLAEALFIDRFLLRVAKLTRPIWYPLAAFGEFVSEWWQTRRLRRLIWGIPLFVALLPLFALVAWFVLGGRSGVSANYQAAIIDARAAKDYSRLQLLERKLVQLGVDSKRMEFNSVLLLERGGNLREAYARAQRLAGADDLGYPPAHLWIVEHLVKNQLAIPTDETQQLVEHHLSALAKLGVKGRELNLLRGLALVQAKRLSEAAELFQPLIDEDPLAAIQRFQIDLALNRVNDARRDALAIRQHLERQRLRGKLIKTGDYQCWANAERFLNDPVRYRAVVGEWLKVDPQSLAARKNMASIYLAEFDNNLESPHSDFRLLASRLQDAFAMAEIPEDFRIRVVALYRQKSSSPVLQNMFDELGQSGSLSSSLAEILGTVAGVEGEWLRAEAWTRQAIAKDERNQLAWNNLACILLQKDDAQALNEALVAADRAVAIAADDYRFRETRGQILLRLKRSQEAVRDLEFALNGMPEATAIHRSLATAYEELGDKELAAQHRSQSQ